MLANYKGMPNTPDNDPIAFSERLNEAMADAGHAGAAGRGAGVWLSKFFKISGPTAWGWLNGKYKPTADKVKQLAPELKVSFQWLMFGEGGKHDFEISSTDQREGKDGNGKKAKDDKVLVRRIVGAHLAAGTGEEVYDFEEVSDRSFDREWMRVRNLNAEHCMLWSAKGDSMYPTIEDGELVLVNLRQRDPEHAKVFALITDDGLRLKLLMRKSDNTWEIRSDNEDKRIYPTETFVPGQIAIMGRVRWHAGEM